MSAARIGYGRYKDDPEHVGCPRAKSDMTPCVARDGHLAQSDSTVLHPETVCIGCSRSPAELLAELERELGREPTRPRGDLAGDVLRDLVREATA